MEFPRDQDLSTWADEAAEKWSEIDYGDREVFTIEKNLFVETPEGVPPSLDPFLLAQMGGLMTVFAACRVKARWERTDVPPTLLQVKVEITTA